MPVFFGLALHASEAFGRLVFLDEGWRGIFCSYLAVAYHVQVPKGFIDLDLVFVLDGCRDFCDEVLVITATDKHDSLSILWHPVVGGKQDEWLSDIVKAYSFQQVFEETQSFWVI